MEISEQLKSIINNYVEITKQKVELDVKISDYIDKMELSDDEKVAIYSGISEYADYGQFCIQNEIGIDAMNLESLIEYRKKNLFHRFYCPICKKNRLPLFKKNK